MPSPIHLHTVADLLARDHTLQLHCLRCDRWRKAPLEHLATQGLADPPITALRFRCAATLRCPAPLRSSRDVSVPAFARRDETSSLVAASCHAHPQLPPARGTGWMGWPSCGGKRRDGEPGRSFEQSRY